MKTWGRLFGSMIWGQLLRTTIMALGVVVVVVVMVIDVVPVNSLYLAQLLGVLVLGLHLGRRRVRAQVFLSASVCS